MGIQRHTQKALQDAGLHFGIIGGLAFMVFILIFREDWRDHFQYLGYLLPVPVISLWLAKKFTWLGGLLFVGLGIGAAIFDVFFSPAHPGQIAGRGLGYTLVFVSIPLVISGLLYLFLWLKMR